MKCFLGIVDQPLSCGWPFPLAGGGRGVLVTGAGRKPDGLVIVRLAEQMMQQPAGAGSCSEGVTIDDYGRVFLSVTFGMSGLVFTA